MEFALQGLPTRHAASPLTRRRMPCEHRRRASETRPGQYHLPNTSALDGAHHSPKPQLRQMCFQPTAVRFVQEMPVTYGSSAASSLAERSERAAVAPISASGQHRFEEGSDDGSAIIERRDTNGATAVSRRKRAGARMWRARGGSGSVGRRAHGLGPQRSHAAVRGAGLALALRSPQTPCEKGSAGDR